MRAIYFGREPPSSRYWKTMDRKPHGEPLLLFCLRLFLCLGGTLSEGAVVRKNVTIVGVEFNWTRSAVSGVWNASLVSESRAAGVVGECPPGRYCPYGSARPVACAAGTYSAQARRATRCAARCPAGMYCPDPAVAVPCPNRTSSLEGARSQLECKCEAGYECRYRKFVSASVGLGVPYRVWLSPAGAGLRQALREAVAASAGVPVGSVQVERVIPGVAGRRLLSAAEASAGAVVSVSVAGASELRGVRDLLAARREFSGRGVRVHWRSMESVSAHLRLL